jgi:hypothetical protein
MEATELETGENRTAVHGELADDQGQLFLNLNAKLERLMAEDYIEVDRYPSGQIYQYLKKDRLAGVIEYDEQEDGVPLLVVDDKLFTWEEIGKILISYEGFQLKLEVLDATDVVEWDA